MAKRDYKDSRRVTIDVAHVATSKPKPNILQKGKYIGYALAITVRQLVRGFKCKNQQVRFSGTPTVA